MSRLQIRTETLRTTIAGQPAVVSVPIVPPDAVGALREGLLRRRQAGCAGVCACGATRRIPAGELGRLYGDRPAAAAPFDHTPDCPGHQDQLRPAIAAWQQRGRRGGRRGAQAR